MAQVYNINQKDSSLEECCTFETNGQDINTEYSSTYIGVLSVFREVFQLLDFLKIITQEQKNEN